MAKFHISGDGIPRPCAAQTPETCTAQGTIAHGDTPQEVAQAFEANRGTDHLAGSRSTRGQRRQQAPSAPLVPDSAREGSGFLRTERYRNVSKMPALFDIDREAHVARRVLNPRVWWIFEEEARASLKKDGTSITVMDDGTLMARRSVRRGKRAPEGYIEAEVDDFTGNSFGLEPLEGSGWKKMVDEALGGGTLEPGTYELCGPKVNGNPEGLVAHQLLPHGADEAVEIPDMRELAALDDGEVYDRLLPIFEDYRDRGIEGVVWAGEGGKRAKLRVKDFFGDANRR